MAKRNKKPAAIPTAKTAMSALTTGEVEAELKRRKLHIARLIARRERLLAMARSLGEEIAGLGGPAAARRTRPSNDTTLAEAMGKVLSGKTMRVAEIAERVQSEGYRSASPNFGRLVTQALRASNKFKRVGRGLYTAK